MDSTTLAVLAWLHAQASQRTWLRWLAALAFVGALLTRETALTLPRAMQVREMLLFAGAFPDILVESESSGHSG